jgi:hypothetical protein
VRPPKNAADAAATTASRFSARIFGQQSAVMAIGDIPDNNVSSPGFAMLARGRQRGGYSVISESAAEML